jgi:hypothetical protein
MTEEEGREGDTRKCGFRPRTFPVLLLSPRALGCCEGATPRRLCGAILKRRL